ncbi:hypothetical protein KY359_02655 [Candidatus Woesearchaeota archaeon]|nr:hypothetical protein [Candidatus Woesearchaeota archaeon]
MDNKILGGLLISVSVLLVVLLLFVRASLVDSQEAVIDKNVEELGVCHAEGEGTCPHERLLNMQIPIFIAIALLVGVASLGAYLIFFERSQKEIISTLKKERHLQSSQEKFDILLKGLDSDERKVILAVKEQDGITQQTLRLRTDMHKSKLSIVLDGLEKKGIIKRVEKGKTKQVFLKISL